MPPRPVALAIGLLAVLALGLTACSDGDGDAEERTPFTRVDTDEQDEDRSDSDDADGDDGSDDGGTAAGSLRDCELEAAVADLTGDEVVEAGIRFGTVVRSGDGGDVQLNDEGCGYEMASGDRFTLADVVDGDEATAIESFEALEASGRGIAVGDLGDSAVIVDGDKLYARTGDRVVVVKYDGDTGVDQAVLEALAAEAIAVDAG
jgi:hypothetical protein